MRESTFDGGGGDGGGSRGRGRRWSASEAADDAVEEAAVAKDLAGIPDHDAAKVGELLGVGEDGHETGSREVARARCRCRAWNSEKDLDVAVCRSSLGPPIPDVEVEVVLRRGAGDKGLDTAVVVVELDKDGVEADITVEHGIICHVGIGTLGSGCEHPLLACRGLIRVHERAQSLTKGVDVLCRGLKVKVETVDDRGAKGTKSITTRLDRSKHGPDLVGHAARSLGCSKAALGVRGSANAKNDGLAIGRLTGADIIPVPVSKRVDADTMTYAISGQLSNWVPGKSVQRSPELAKLTCGFERTCMKARGIICDA